MAVAATYDQQGVLQSTDQIVATWKKQLEQAREDRRQPERIWLSNLAFAGGQHWLGFPEGTTESRHLRDLDPGRYAGRNLYTADRITEYLRAQLGELSVGDDRLEMQAVQEGNSAEEVAKELNSGVRYAWDHEWNAQKALRRVRGYTLTMGRAAIRMRFDASKGPVAGRLPITPDGQQVTDPNELQSLQQNGTLLDGSLPQFQTVNEGRTILEPLTAFHLFTPPGIPHEDDFPWEAIGRPVPLDQVLDEFGEAAQGLTEDNDIGSAAGIATGQRVTVGSNQGRLRGHIWLYTCYDRPCRRYPNGRVVVLAGNSYRILQIREQLDYKKPNGDWHSGIIYFHWQRLDDRPHSRAFIENLKDAQRTINEIKTAQLEILWRGMPKAFTKKGDLIHNPKGLPLENIELEKDAAQPVFFGGIGPGAWMDAMLAACDGDLSHASTLSPLKLGENPQGVDTYAQLQLLNQNENYKRSDIILDHQQQIGLMQELGVYDIQTYWPEQKQILVAGEEGQIQHATFRKSTIPAFFQSKVADGVALDRSAAAELKKVDAIWSAATQTGVTQGPNAQKWTEWYAKSLDADKALDLPDAETDSQIELAYYENTLLLQGDGEMPQPADHDVMPVHIPIHREALDQARASGDMAAVQRIHAHIGASTQAASIARKAWRSIDPADTNDLASDIALDEDQALRENEMLIAGVPLNPEELQKALAALQHDINPETGAKLLPTDDMHGILERAALKPTLIENLELHMDRHGKVIKSQPFEQFPQDVRRRFLTHFDLTRNLYLSIPLLPTVMTPPKVSLQLRESVGPTTIAEVLRRAGVPEADPQTLATEPPMENMVQDSVDKPDTDSGSPGQTGSPTPKPADESKK